MAVTTGRFSVAPAEGIGPYRQVFDIWIKDIWGETGSIVGVWWPKIGQREATVMFSDGLLAERTTNLLSPKTRRSATQRPKDPETGDYWCIWEDDSKADRNGGRGRKHDHG